MPVATFDTLKFSKALREAGVPEKQADAEAAVLSDVFSINFRDVTTKDDLKSTKDELKTELKHLEERMDYRFKDLEQRFDAKLDSVQKMLSNEISLLRAEMNRTETRNRGEFILMRWMMGVVITLCTGIAIRLFLFGVR
jgi:hypothetical protein